MAKRENMFLDPPEDVKIMIRASASTDPTEAYNAQLDFLAAMVSPLRKGILTGGVFDGVFQSYQLEPNASPEYYLDLVAPGVEAQHKAYAIPSTGRIPDHTFESDYIMLPTFEVGNAITWPLKLARTSRWDQIGRALQLYKAGYVKKLNDDKAAVLLTAAKDRGIYVQDVNAGAGKLTLRLITLMKQVMRRQGGGNGSGAMSKMTDMWASLEALDTLRELTLADIDDVTRRTIINADGHIGNLAGVDFHELYEFGVSQEYQNLYLDPNGINGALGANDIEIVLGVDLQENDSFVNPIRYALETFPDATMHRQNMAGVYGRTEYGLGVLDGRRVLLGSL